MSVHCDYCAEPAVWYATADSPRSELLHSRFVCRSERHLIRAREVLGPGVSIVELDAAGRSR